MLRVNDYCIQDGVLSKLTRIGVGPYGAKGLALLFIFGGDGVKSHLTTWNINRNKDPLTFQDFIWQMDKFLKQKEHLSGKDKAFIKGALLFLLSREPC